MDLKDRSTHIRQSIGQADIPDALDALLEYLQQSPRLKGFLAVALNIQSLYHRTKEKELKGTITAEQASANYNVVNDSIIQVLDQLEAGLTQPRGFDPKVRTQRLQIWQITLTAIIAVGIVAVALILLREDGGETVDTSCPGFTQPSEFNVLLLPFKNLSEGELKPEYTIKGRLEKFCNEYQVPTQVRVYDNYYLRPNAQLPDFPLAGQLGSECHAGLIVWGTAERLPNGRIDVTSRFKFLGSDDNFALQKIQFEGETSVDTILSISSIGRQGNITKDIEELVLTLFGLLAHEQGNHEAAIASLEQTQTAQGRDTANVLLTQMILADSYLATQQPEKALQSYDRVLQVDPDYNLARNNRGFLLLETKKFKEAVTDFSNILERQPQDKEARIGRAAAYMELKETDKAERDIQVIKRDDPAVKLPVLKNLQTIRKLE